MKAMMHTEYGTPDVLSLGDLPNPKPAEDEVLIAVKAAGVNWADWSMVSGMGADHVIDYAVEDFTNGDIKYDVILDIADVHSMGDRGRVLTERGTVKPNSGRGGPRFGSVGRVVGAWLRSPFAKQNLKPFLSLGKKEDLSQLVDWIESGEARAVVGRTFTLAETPEAVTYVGEGHARGETVITF